MHIVEIAKVIDEKIKLLEYSRTKIMEYADNKAIANAEYEKQLAITIIKLKNGEQLEIDGNIIEKPPATIIEKIARGICWKEKLSADKAEAEYKAFITKIDCVLAELNGAQSLNRYLDKT